MSETPLKRALKVTTILNLVTNSGPDSQKTLYISYKMTGNIEHVSTPFIEGRNEIILTLPIDANYWGEGFMVEISALPEDLIYASSTVHILSVCWEEQ